MFEVNDWNEYKRSLIIVTSITLFATFAAVISTILTADLPPVEAATDSIAYGVLIPAILFQLPLYETIYDDWGGPKDITYVTLMTFLLWFVVWSIILTAGLLP